MTRPAKPRCGEKIMGGVCGRSAGHGERLPCAVNPAPRGFAAMTALQREAIASKGGKAAHGPGAKGHEWTKKTAAEAGRLGGKVSRGGRGKLPPGSTEP